MTSSAAQVRTAPAASSTEGGLIPVLEIGGTHIIAALVEPESGHVAESHRHDLDSAGTRTEILDTLTRAAQTLGVHRYWGVAIPGPFDYEHGIGRFAHVGKFEALAGLDLGHALSMRFGDNPKIVFVNDADAFGIGEVIAGAGHGHRRAVCLTLGTGIGSAFIADGEPVNDGRTVPPDGSVHLLRWKGDYIEETVSRRAIRSRYTQLSGDSRDVREIAELARNHDPGARQAFDECFAALGSCLAPWLSSFGATALILGGSIAGSFDLIEEPLHDGIRAAEPTLKITPQPAAHPETAALIGTAHTTQARRRAEETSD
jgi:glucokinase